MNIKQMLERMGAVSPPMQPGILATASEFRQRVAVWNPVSLKSQALFYEFEAGPEGGEATIVPDDCMNILIKLPGCGGRAAEGWVSGLSTQALPLLLEPGATYFGVKPYGASGMREGRFAVRELQDTAAPFEEAFGGAAGAFYEDLARAGGFSARIGCFLRFAQREIVDPSYEPDFVEYFTALCCVADDDARLRDCVEWTGYSQRYFRGRFHDRFGISPKRYTSVLRFQKAVKGYLSRPGGAQGPASTCVYAACWRPGAAAPEPGALYLRYGYYDQAHFIKEFRRYAGSAPGDYVRRHAAILWPDPAAGAQAQV
jgi:AraC-like DNA-binding protein